jgi:curli biogenesis system outer membrane secretion channel CsgG
MKSWLFLLLVLPLAGCLTTSSSKPLPRAIRPYKVPTIAVLNFENKAHFPYNWDLGEGVRELLVNELVKSGRFSVLTREDLGPVLQELDLQDNPRFRQQLRAKYGQLKNVQYLVKGALTDFTHVSGGGVRGALNEAGSLIGLGGDVETAVVSMTLYVIELESGEILASETLEERVYAGGVEMTGTYEKLAFGGSAFYRTPLGKATRGLMKRALSQVGDSIARERWHPRVIRAREDGRIFVSGGIDRALSEESVWAVFRRGKELADPETGDVLGHEDDVQVGRVRLLAVKDKHSIAEVLDDQGIATGHMLRPLK